jgi:hypothetical protein
MMEQLEVPVELVCHILGYAKSLASLVLGVGDQAQLH